MNDIIKIAYGESQMTLENEVMKAVCRVGISVNKEELVKALELSESLVRCKECKHRLTERVVSKNDPHWIIYEVGDCRRMLGTVKDDDFCSYGERKESE